MTTSPPPSESVSSIPWRSVVLFLLTLLVIGFCFAVIAPFFPAITGAVALAVAVQKPYGWLERKVGNRTLSAALGVLLVVLLIVVPILLVVQSLGRQVVYLAAAIQSGSARDWVTEFVNRIPWLNSLADRALGLVDVQEAARGTAGFVANRLQRVLTGSVETATQLVLMLFTLFFTLRDRVLAARMLRSVLPLNDPQRDYLLDRMRNTIEASLQGSVTIAAIQGSLGGFMFAILGLPSALVWALTMAILATIPSLGTFLVWMPAAIYLAVSGHLVKGIVLFAWGTLVIGTVDNVLYPSLVGTKMQLHTVPVLFAVLGGIALFGISGLVLGPLLLTVGVALIRIWNGSALATES